MLNDITIVLVQEEELITHISSMASYSIEAERKMIELPYKISIVDTLAMHIPTEIPSVITLQMLHVITLTLTHVSYVCKTSYFLITGTRKSSIEAL